MGTYQLKQARSYYAEHSKANGRFEIQLCRHVGPLSLSSHGLQAEDPMLIRGRIHSRFWNQTKYLIYVLVDKKMSGTDSIIGYCCQCKNGLRAVGCCAHIMTVIWYLRYGRYLSEIKSPGKQFDDFFKDFIYPDSTDTD